MVAAVRRTHRAPLAATRDRRLPQLGLTLLMLWLGLHPYATVPSRYGVVGIAARMPYHARGKMLVQRRAASVDQARAPMLLTQRPLTSRGPLTSAPASSVASHAPRQAILPRRAARVCRAPLTVLPPPGPCGDRWRAAEQANPEGRLAAPPSVSVQSIWRALWAAGSPLANDNPRRGHETYAEYLWDRGKALGIDPAVVMAIFRQESGYGTHGMATLTHDLGNSRPGIGQQQVCGGDGCYGYDATWFDGIDSIYRLLRRYGAQGYSSVDQIIAVWAPPSDGNDDLAYLYGVYQTMQALNSSSS